MQPVFTKFVNLNVSNSVHIIKIIVCIADILWAVWCFAIVSWNTCGTILIFVYIFISFAYPSDTDQSLIM